MTYYIERNDDNGDLQDRAVFCARTCAWDYADQLTGIAGATSGEPFEPLHRWTGTGWCAPFEFLGTHESDSDTFCDWCGVLMSLGINTDRTDCDWSCVPVVVNRGQTDRPERCEHDEFVQVAMLPRQWEAEIIHPDTSADLAYGELDDVIDRVQAFRVTSPDARIHIRSIA